jgi:transposase InsO family protein
MRTRHGITQVRGFKNVLRLSQFQSFLDEHPEAQKRWNILRPLLDETLTMEQAANTFRVSEKTIKRWQGQYDPNQWYSLISQSKKPQTTPRTKTVLERTQRVMEIANTHLAWGAPKIWAYIRQEDPYALHMKKRTVSRILARGLLSGEIVPRVKLKALVHHRRDVRGRTINRVKNSTDPALAPGDRVHNDGVVVQIFLAAKGELRKLYFSNTIDRFSKLAMVVVGEHLVPSLTIESHRRLEVILGEKIKEKINDNGSENLGACIEFYEAENIVQLYTYPHAPKQNAVCERFNRTFQEECLLGKRIDLTQSIEIIQEQINAWLVEYNTERPHEGIDNMTPIRKLVAWKFQQLPKERQADPLCGQMLWRGTDRCIFPLKMVHCLRWMKLHFRHRLQTLRL